MKYHDLLAVGELRLGAPPAEPTRALRFATSDLDPAEWAVQARARLDRLLGMVTTAAPAQGTVVRSVIDDQVETLIVALEMNPMLSMPGYLLRPCGTARPTGRVVMALHGHGEVEACLDVDGVDEDYHHRFAAHLARHGFTVLVPELRGFGALYDLAAADPGANLRYWRWGEPMAYTLQTDAFLHGRTTLGDTIGDLLAWEGWLVDTLDVDAIDVVGISWGGDLACTYPIFSTRVRSIFASGTLGSFADIFRVGGNAPAHCVPGVLNWMDRADIAGLNAPTPIAIHYGANDVPGPDNSTAAFNDTALRSVVELRAIYAAAHGPEPELIISDGLGHEMDLPAITSWLRRQS